MSTLSTATPLNVFIVKPNHDCDSSKCTSDLLPGLLPRVMSVSCLPWCMKSNEDLHEMKVGAAFNRPIGHQEYLVMPVGLLLPLAAMTDNRLPPGQSCPGETAPPDFLQCRQSGCWLSWFPFPQTLFNRNKSQHIFSTEHQTQFCSIHTNMELLLTQFPVHLLTSSHFIHKLALKNVHVRIQL